MCWVTNYCYMIQIIIYLPHASNNITNNSNSNSNSSSDSLSHNFNAANIIPNILPNFIAFQTQTANVVGNATSLQAQTQQPPQPQPQILQQIPILTQPTMLGNTTNLHLNNNFPNVPSHFINNQFSNNMKFNAMPVNCCEYIYIVICKFEEVFSVVLRENV